MVLVAFGVRACRSAVKRPLDPCRREHPLLCLRLAVPAVTFWLATTAYGSAEPSPPERNADGTASIVVEQPASPADGTWPAALAPAASTAPVGPPPGPAVAETLLAELLAPSSMTADLSARPQSLVEPLQRSGDRSRRLWIVQAYWKVAMAQAAARSCGEACQRIELVAPGADPHDRAVLDVASSAAQADLAESMALLGVARQELIDLARLPPGEPPPLAVDRPLAAPYQTHFDAIFANRVATGRVRAIAATLPARHDALAGRSVAVTAARTAFAMAEADHAKGQRPIEAVVAAHAAVVAQEREFLRAVLSYNTDIAEYAMAVADLSVPDEAFVAMLIGSPPPRVGGPNDTAADTPLPR
jgi:hypothetical protein